MSSKECMEKLSSVLFWDIDMEQADMDKYPAHFIQRVLEYGNMVRTLDPVCLSYICAISHTKPEEYRCYHTRQLNPIPWNY